MADDKSKFQLQFIQGMRAIISIALEATENILFLPLTTDHCAHTG